MTASGRLSRKPASSRSRRPPCIRRLVGERRRGRFGRRAEAGDAGDILGAGAQPAFLAAAADQRLGQMQACVRADERADALRTADLVRRKRQKIGAQLIDIAMEFVPAACTASTCSSPPAS